MICLNQKFYIITDHIRNRKLSNYKCEALINLNYVTSPSNADNLMVFCDKEKAETHRMRNQEYIDNYVTLNVDSHDVCKLCECFALDVDMI